MTPDDKNIFKILADLQYSNDRVVLLLGEVHGSRQMAILRNKLLRMANIGFFEAPAEQLLGKNGGRSLNPQQAEQFRAMAHKLPPQPGIESLIDLAEAATLPLRAVFMDESGKKRNRLELAMDAFNTVRHTPQDTLHEPLKEIALGRRIDRVRTSNDHMAGVMIDELKSIPKPKPLFAVACVGAAHLRPGHHRLTGTQSDMKHRLQSAGYKVISIEMMPLPKIPNMEIGDHVATKSLDNEVDYAVGVIDPEARKAHIGRA